MAATVYGDRWKLERPLDEGGQAYTYIVVDTKGDGQSKYVLKRLKNTKRLDRFKVEVDAIRRINHPNVIKLIDFDLDTEKPYMVSEYCSGGNLTSTKGYWKNRSDEALMRFMEICEGLTVAHCQEKIVHRDIKPDNILLRSPQGPSVVADFGICYIEEDERQTLTQEQVGARFFMSPEMEDGRADSITARSDVYSMGKILYWLLSDGKVFSREKHREGGYNLVDIHRDNAFEHANRLLDKMIVNSPRSRLEDASYVMEEAHKLRRLLNRGYNAPSGSLPQMCTYCGQGVYKIVARENNAVYNFGIRPTGNPDWRILVCEECGHSQLFRLDLATKRSQWWGESPRVLY